MSSNDLVQKERNKGVKRVMETVERHVPKRSDAHEDIRDAVIDSFDLVVTRVERYASQGNGNRPESLQEARGKEV